MYIRDGYIFHQAADTRVVKEHSLPGGENLPGKDLMALVLKGILYITFFQNVNSAIFATLKMTYA